MEYKDARLNKICLEESANFHVTCSNMDRKEIEGKGIKVFFVWRIGLHQPSRCLCGNKRASRFLRLAVGQWTGTGHWSCVFSCWMELLRETMHTDLLPLSLSLTRLSRSNLSHLNLWWAADEPRSRAVIVSAWKHLRSAAETTPDCSAFVFLNVFEGFAWAVKTMMV